MFRVTKSHKILFVLFFVAVATAASSKISRAQTDRPPRIYFIPVLTLQEANQSGDIGILLFSPTGISAYEFVIDFDPQFIRVDDVQFIDPPSGANLMKLGPDIKNDLGQVTVGALSLERQSITGELPYTVVRLKVTLLKEGLTHLNLRRVVLRDTNFEPITRFYTAYGTVRTLRPDPQPRRLEANSIRPVEGRPLTFNFDYANIGGGDAPESSYQLLIDDNVVYEDRLSELPSEEATELIRIPPLPGGWNAVEGRHTARVIVDPGNEIAEADETNNEAVLAFTVETAASTPAPSEGLTLLPGGNKVKWTFAPSAIKDVVARLNSQCGGNVVRAGSYLRNGWWESYRAGYGGVNFNLEPGRTYYLQATKPCTWSP
jgi:hypothetical protein